MYNKVRKLNYNILPGIYKTSCELKVVFAPNSHNKSLQIILVIIIKGWSNCILKVCMCVNHAN